jgi:hypothetical protein
MQEAFGLLEQVAISLRAQGGSAKAAGRQGECKMQCDELIHPVDRRPGKECLHG